MSSGLIALIDDMAAIAKLAAASLDDAKSRGQGSGHRGRRRRNHSALRGRFDAERELPIVGKIALGSLRNKLVFLLPVTLQ